MVIMIVPGRYTTNCLTQRVWYRSSCMNMHGRTNQAPSQLFSLMKYNWKRQWPSSGSGWSRASCLYQWHERCYWRTVLISFRFYQVKSILILFHLLCYMSTCFHIAMMLLCLCPFVLIQLCTYIIWVEESSRNYNMLYPCLTLLIGFKAPVAAKRHYFPPTFVAYTCRYYVHPNAQSKNHAARSYRSSSLVEPVGSAQGLARTHPSPSRCTWTAYRLSWDQRSSYRWRQRLQHL